MAKVTKKSLKKRASQTEIKRDEVVRLPAPPIEPGMLSLIISKVDLETFTNLMTICAKTFEEQALKAAELNDNGEFRRLQARYQLSTAFALKLADCLKMPEPESRDMH